MFNLFKYDIFSKFFKLKLYIIIKYNTKENELEFELNEMIDDSKQ